MKTSIVIMIVGFWLAFLTVMQSFQAWDRLLYANNFSLVSWIIALLFVMPIAFGYTSLFLSLYTQKRPRVESITITLILGVCVGLVFILIHVFSQSREPIFLPTYVLFDQYMRSHHQTVLTYMDYGNTLLLSATCLWWAVTGILLLLLLLPRTRRRNV